MKVVIVNAYNRHNAGDAALLSALIGQIDAAFAGCDICFAGLENPGEHPEFEGVRNVGSIRRWAGEPSVARHRRVGRKGVAVAVALAPRRALRWLSARPVDRGPVEPLSELRAIAQADLVVGLGGGYLNGAASRAGTLNVVFLLLPVFLATRLQRPTVLAPQSYGPFGRWTQVQLVRSCLNRVGRIVVREDTSMAQLRSAGVHDRLLERGVDSAFALAGERHVIAATPDEAGHPRVGITARAWLPGRGQEAYERSLAAFTDWLHRSRGAVVTLVPQVTSDYGDDDDRRVSRRIASYCSTEPIVIEEQLDHPTLRAVYRSLDYVVGTRFHSVIFSLTGGTPALAIEYEHKASGIMADLGLAEWVLPMATVTTTALCDRFAALEEARSDYERQMKERLPDYEARARGFVDVLRRSVP